MATATGTFEITSGSEDAYEEQAGLRLTRARGTQRFTGDIEGEGTVEWLMCYLPDGSARFVGLQRIVGSIRGVGTGSIVIESAGSHDGTGSEGTWRVIPGAGGGDMADLAGEGGFVARGGPEVSYHLDYRLG